MGGGCIGDPAEVLNSLFQLGGEWRRRPGPDPRHGLSVGGSAVLPCAFSRKPQRVWVLPCEVEAVVDDHSSGAKVLWELRPRLDGANISMLGQFAHEAECLFPPLTMLTTVLPKGSGDQHAAAMNEAPRVSRWPSVNALRRNPEQLSQAMSDACSEYGKTFVRIQVLPSFV